MYGFKKTTQGGGSFGLNQNARLTNFEYNPNGSKNEDGNAECVDISVDINGREFRQRFYKVEKVWTEPKEGTSEEITNKNSEEYKAAFERDTERLSKLVSQYGIAIVGEKEFEEAMEAATFNNFKGFIETIERIIKAQEDWNTKPIDVFLMYQWQPKGENTRTYLELPNKLKRAKDGFFVTAHQEGDYQPTESGSLRYINEDGKVHPIKRSLWFRNSNFAKLTDFSEGEEQTQEGIEMNSDSSGTNW